MEPVVRRLSCMVASNGHLRGSRSALYKNASGKVRTLML